AGNAPVPVRGCVCIDRIAGDHCVVAHRWRRRAALETARRTGSIVDLDVERSSNMQHLTIATSSGIIWLTLVTHFGAALLALAAGTLAPSPATGGPLHVAVAKGGRLHKQSGLVFTFAMITTGILASVLSAYEGKSVVGGLFV